MSGSLKIGKLFGIDVKVHFTFLLILVFGALRFGGSAGPWYGVVVIIALFTIVVLHELGHSLAAMGYNIPVRDITLLPIGGVARLERMPEKPIQELVVALAGPAVNVLLAALLLPIIYALSLVQSVPFTVAFEFPPAATLLGLLHYLFWTNITLLVFNMIPAFPLDGGRVFRAIVGFFTNYQNATKIAVNVGRLFAIGMGLVGIFVTGQILLTIIAFFIFVVGGQEGQAVAARSLLRNIQARQALSDNSVALSPYATVGQVASMMLNNRQRNFAILDSVSGQFLGVATSKGVSQAMQQGHWHKHITEIMHHARHIPTIALNASLDEVQDKLAGASSHVVAVYDGLHFRGLLTANDIYRAFRFLSQNGRFAYQVAL